MSLRIERVESNSKGAFVIHVDGERAGELTYSRAGDQLIIIDHTGVDDSHRGEGLARKLVEAAVGWARDSDTKVIPLCPYAKAKIDETPEWQDVLEN